VHGVQWARDDEIEGYSRPLQDLIVQQGPTWPWEERFVEVLWSDVVEQKEEDLIAGTEALADVLTGNYAGAIFDVLKVLGPRFGCKFESQDEGLPTPARERIGSKSGFDKAASAILDLVFYFCDKDCRKQIQSRVRDKLKAAKGPPIAFGHSLGSVI